MERVSKLAICGPARAGKDSVAGYLTLFYDYQPFAFADDMKRIYYDIFGAQAGKDREGLIWFGEKCCERDPYVWINKVSRKIDDYLTRYPNGRVVITDVRKPTEVEWLRDNGYTLIRVDCDEDIRIERMRARGDRFNEDDLRHHTETYTQTIDVDYEIENNDTLAELETKIDDIMAELGITQREAFSGL